MISVGPQDILSQLGYAHFEILKDQTKRKQVAILFHINE